MKKIEVDNIPWLFEHYGDEILSGEYILAVDYHREFNGSDLVVYDVYGLDVESQKEFHKWCDENGGDEETYEVDRVTLVRID